MTCNTTSEVVCCIAPCADGFHARDCIGGGRFWWAICDEIIYHSVITNLSSTFVARKFRQLHTDHFWFQSSCGNFLATNVLLRNGNILPSDTPFSLLAFFQHIDGFDTSFESGEIVPLFKPVLHKRSMSNLSWEEFVHRFCMYFCSPSWLLPRIRTQSITSCVCFPQELYKGTISPDSFDAKLKLNDQKSGKI